MPTAARGPTCWIRMNAVDSHRCLSFVLLLGALPSLFPTSASAAPPDDKEEVLAGMGSDDVPASQGVGFYEALAKQHPTEAQNHQLLAAAYARQGRGDDARRSAKRAIELAPDSAEMQQALGLIEEGDDKLGAAQVAFERALALDKGVENRLDLARVLYRQDKRVEAEAIYAAVATDFGSAADVQTALGDAYKGMGRYEEAGVAYDKAFELFTTDASKADALTDKARMAADQGDIRTALDTLTRARLLAPDDADVHYNLGVVYVRAGQFDAAITAFDAAVKIKPEHANALNNKGVALQKQKKIEESVQAFEQAIAIDGRNSFARYNLGVSLFKLRRFKEAEVAFEKTLELESNNADAKFFLGEIYFQLGDTKKALRLYKDALRSNPDDASTHRRLGDVYLNNGELDLAVGEYWAAVDADKESADHRSQLMRVLLVRNKDNGDVRRAVKLGDEGLLLNPAALDVRIALAAAESQAGRSPKARQLLEEGVKTSPQDPKAQTALGRFLLEQGKIADAQAAFQGALAIDARYAPALAGDGDASLSQGDAVNAQKRFEDALQIDPTLADARAELGYILYKTDKNQLALKELSRAAEDNLHSGKAWFYLAFAQYKEGQKDQAVVSLERAVAAQPDLAEAWLQLGKAYLSTQRNVEAKKAFTAAEKARGGNYEEARLELERLQ